MSQNLILIIIPRIKSYENNTADVCKYKKKFNFRFFLALVKIRSRKNEIKKIIANDLHAND